MLRSLFTDHPLSSPSRAKNQLPDCRKVDPAFTSDFRSRERLHPGVYNVPLPSRQSSPYVPSLHNGRFHAHPGSRHREPSQPPFPLSPFLTSSHKACHLVFNRYEPVNPLSHLALLIVVPAILTRVLSSSFSSFLPVLACTYLLYYTTILLSILVYRLSPFHPLAKYPGPIPCRISKFWMAWVSSGGKQHKYYYELHQKYGDVVRIGEQSSVPILFLHLTLPTQGPNELSFRNADAISPLMGYFGLPKGPRTVTLLVLSNLHTHLL